MLYLLQHIIEPIKEYKPMKKKQFFYTFAAGIFAAAILAGGLVSSPTLVSADEEPTAEATDASNNPQDNNASQLQTLLENEGFYVQQGSFYELDTLKEASAGRLLSCFGNNAGSSYMVFNLPAAPEIVVLPSPILPIVSSC